MRRIFLLLAIALFNFGVFGQVVSEGSLFAKDRKGKDLGSCPLKTTSVRADISGFIARVNVRQEFENSFQEAIEAVYTFPLSQNGAVDQMTMTIGERVIRGKIMKREEARQVYESAKSAGHAASLLDQERPNIFTQSVANIPPGEKIVIDISYVETLKYEDGVYEFVFPMTVGPRYIPGRVPDASKISPPIAETRAGHDISIEVNLNAGVPVEEIRSTSHQIEQVNVTPSNARVTLRSEKTIPNKDFVFRYDVSGKRIEDAVLAHRGERGGFFTLVLQPPDKIANEDRTPKEIVFVLDTSGSMSGFPIEKAKEAMRMSLDGLYPDDTFNLITFAGDTRVLFEEPVPATQANIETARAFLDEHQGGGGTEMMKAIRTALEPSDSKEHLRIVCFMTDGYVGNENEIIAEVQKHPKARVFSFGIGNSVNRFLLDKMAEAGKGEVEYVSLDDDGSKAAKRFYERVRTPLLTDLIIEWNGVPVADVYPSKLGDLFSAKPVIVNGRYTKGGAGNIKLRGLVAGMPYERSIAFSLPEAEPANNVLATLWARKRVDELSVAALNAKAPERANTEITRLGLDFGIMTQFTSFVAVEDRVVNHNGQPMTIQVPVNIPEGVDREKAGGNVVETVTVTGGGGGGGAQTQASTVGRSVKPRQIANLPLNSRSPSNLMVLTPGTASNAQTGTGQGSGRGTGSVSGTGSGYGSGSGDGSGNGTGPVNQGDLADQARNPAVAPDPKVPRLENPSLALPPPSTDGNSGFSKSYKRWGDPNSKSASLSNGPGTSGGNVGPPAKVGATTTPLQILSKPLASYTESARTNNVQGSVRLKIVLLASGAVGSITPVTRLPHGLTEQAIAAARQIRFRPKMINGVPQSVVATFDYRFPSGGGVSVAKGMEEIHNGAASETLKTALPPELVREQSLKEKLHSWIYSLVKRLRLSNNDLTANEAKFVRDGKAEIRIVLSMKSAEAIEKLKALGMEIENSKDGINVSGRIAVEKLALLAEFDSVKLVLPIIR